jgi:hypothetical protein
MEGEDCLDEAGDPGRRAAELAEVRKGLEGGDGLFDQCPGLRMGPVDGLLAGGEAVPSAAVRETDCAACALVALVRPAGEGARVPGILGVRGREPYASPRIIGPCVRVDGCRSDITRGIRVDGAPPEACALRC